MTNARIATMDARMPRAEALATSAISAALTQDGTYRLGSVGSADAILEAKLVEIDYSSIRGSRLDTLLPEELDSRVQISWTLMDGKDRTKVLAAGTASGESQLFVDSNLQTARNNALPDALITHAVQPPTPRERDPGAWPARCAPCSIPCRCTIS